MSRFRYLPSAEAEMNEAAQFYETEASGLGAEFLDEIQRALDRILNWPELGKIVSANFRSSVLARFPFSLVYRIEDDTVLMVAVAHQRRRPNYWITRANR